METYNTLTGRVLDLMNLDHEKEAYFRRCYEAYRVNMRWGEFGNLVAGEENPLVRAAGGWVTRVVYDHPLFQAVRDLEDRLGLRQGELAPEPGLDTEREPLVDQWVPVSEAATSKAVTISAVHQAIDRGDLIARPAKPGGAWLVVSVNSLARWTPNPVRQAAGRRAAGAR